MPNVRLRSHTDCICVLGSTKAEFIVGQLLCFLRPAYPINLGNLELYTVSSHFFQSILAFPSHESQSDNQSRQAGARCSTSLMPRPGRGFVQISGHLPIDLRCAAASKDEQIIIQVGDLKELRSGSKRQANGDTKPYLPSNGSCTDEGVTERTNAM